MLKVLADKVLAFTRGEKDGEGHEIEVKTKIGFCDLPDWVAETSFFKLAKLDGSVKGFTSVAEGDQALKDQEKATALREEIAALEEKRDLLLASTVVVPPVVPTTIINLSDTDNKTGDSKSDDSSTDNTDATDTAANTAPEGTDKKAVKNAAKK
jgi:hypothetical protein